MTRQRDIVAAFCLAVAAHCLAAICADTLYALRPRESAPVFRTGESSVRLTVLPRTEPARETPAEYKATVLPKPVAAVRDEPRVDEKIALHQEPPSPAKSASVVQSPREQMAEPDRADPTDRADQPDPAPADADNRRKGIESSRIAISDIRPHYPFGSRLRGEEGIVRVITLVDSSGQVAKAEILETSGHAGLDRAALDAVRSARFVQPGNSAGLAETVVSFRFKLVD